MEGLMQKSIMGLFRKENPLDRAFAEMEEDMTAMIDLDVSAPSLDAGDDIDTSGSVGALRDQADDEGTRLTTYTQSRLASLQVYEDMHRAAKQDLERLASSMARVVSAHHSTNTFLSSVHGSILRANELELTNAALLAENRRLAHAADRVKRLSSQLEALTEGYKRKETKFSEENEAMRAALGVVQTELNEARSAQTAMEFERAELLNQLAGKSAALDRVTREAEIMRERHVNTAMDLESTQRAQTEIERKFNELSAVYTTEHSMIAELRGKLSESEKEVFRLQKALDNSQARLSEAQETHAQLENESSRRQRDQATEIQKLRGEIDALRARIEVAGRAQQNADNELGELKHKVAELATENTIGAEKIASLSMELASERKLAASRGPAQSPEASSSAAVIEGQAREIERLRRDHAAMRGEIKRLSVFEAHARRQAQAAVPTLEDTRRRAEAVPHAAE